MLFTGVIAFPFSRERIVEVKEEIIKTLFIFFLFFVCGLFEKLKLTKKLKNLSRYFNVCGGKDVWK